MKDFNFKELIQNIEGNWKGEGIGMFPTIKKFEFIEHLSFKKDERRAIIHYEQQTWIKKDEFNSKRNAHWESGFISFEKENVFMNNVQSSGRIELLNLKSIEAFGKEVKLIFTSKNIYNDERMLSSQRVWSFNENNFYYEMFMNTKTTKNTTIHLEANLNKC